MHVVSNIKIVNAESDEQLDEVRLLIREFVKWHRERHTADIELINKYFDAVAFEEELASLPGKYSPPIGRLLLALYDDEPAGCVALREIDSDNCEMKRMFVYKHFQGKGIGKLLAKNLIDCARAIGYKKMKLDTSFRQTEAMKLYQSVGFKKTKPYYTLTKDVEDWLVFFDLNL